MRKASRAIILHEDKVLVTKRTKFGSVYYILIGGGVDMGETIEEALLREIREEAGIQVKDLKLVYIEDAGEPYGLQHIFTCQYVSGEPVLSPDSDEAKISAMGQNLYEPVWLSLHELATVPFRSERLRQAILRGISEGFPEKPVDITHDS